jgi:hypothetical protein
MPRATILLEGQQLYGLSDRLDPLAEQHRTPLRNAHHHLEKRSQDGNFFGPK